MTGRTSFYVLHTDGFFFPLKIFQSAVVGSPDPGAMDMKVVFI
jgi:hypothetical protein